MLIRLLRAHLGPYRRLLLARRRAPGGADHRPRCCCRRLNARIIDKGVLHRRHRLHPVAPARSCSASPSSRACSPPPPCTSAPGSPWASAATCGRNLFHQVTELLGPRGRRVRRAVAHHPHHQRRAAGADARRDGRARWRSARRSRSSSASSWPSARTSGCRSILLVSIPAAAIVLGIVVARMVPAFQLMQERIDQINRVLREQITGIRVVRAFVREPRGDRSASTTPTRELTDVVAAGRPADVVDVPDRQPAHQPVERRRAVDRRRPHRRRRHQGRLARRLPQLPRADPVVGRDGDVHGVDDPEGVGVGRTASRRCSTPTSSVVPPDRPGHRGAPSTGTLELRDVGFHYPGAEHAVLSDISLHDDGRARRRRSSAAPAPARRRSSTSSPGCSTPRRARCSSTASTCASSTPSCCGTRIGLVPQKPYLFSGTVASNLRYGKPDATEAEMWEALEVAQAADFVRAMPGGLEAAIEQGGTNVSGGQRQRLSIARALVRRPEIYVFDDSFSALDLATDARLRAALAPVHPRRRGRDRRPAGLDDLRPPTRSSCSTTARSSARGTHDELLADVPDLRRDRRVPDRRGGGGMTDRSTSTTSRRRGRRAATVAAAADAGAAGPPARRSASRPSGRRTSATRVRRLWRAARRRSGRCSSLVVVLAVVSDGAQRARPAGARPRHRRHRRAASSSAGGHRLRRAAPHAARGGRRSTSAPAALGVVHRATSSPASCSA